MAKKARILIVNNESTYMRDLEKTVRNHAAGKAETDTVHVKDAKSKIKSDDIPYDAVILSGSFKRRYDSPEVQYVIKTIDKHNKAIDKYNEDNKDNPKEHIKIYGACLGHQALVHYYKGKIVDLGKYQKGQKKIQLKNGREVTTHKHHRLGVTEVSGLEVIAESNVKDVKDNDIRIIEAVKHPTKPYVSSQGHPERKGHAQDMLYDFLSSVYNKAR